jgi:ribosomal protein S18 acetylase RimI-like enzyme
VSRSHVRVRPAELADVPQLARLGESELPSAAFGGRDGKVQRRLADVLNSSDRHIFVATDEATDAVAGFILVYDDEVGAIMRTPALHISHLVVDKPLRRRGIGRALISACVHLAEQRGVEHIIASAVTSSRDANRYLARLGFAPLVVRRIAPTAVLRRSLGLHDGQDRLALIRRVRTGQRAARAAGSPWETRGVRRGA